MSRTCPACQTEYDDHVFHCPEDGQSLSAEPVVDELLGRMIGSYRVERLLGRGGMGAVYMGVHPAIGSRVAIKFLHPHYSGDEKIVERFFNEARAVNLIGHDNILKILDLDVTEDGRHYFVMEFLHGQTLQSLLRAGQPLGLDVVGPILLQICEALQAAHARGIVHRDLKPDNVHLISLKGKKNFVKIVDFGIARVIDEEGLSTGRTQTGMVMGTPAYMSPEQAGGLTSKIDGRSDVYSLGVMMFQLATGRLPFPGTSFGEVLVGHLQTQPPAPRTLNPSLSEAYQAVILRCLQKDQAARYATMAELHDALWAVMQQEGLSRELPPATEPESEPARLATPSPRARPPRSRGFRHPSRPAPPAQEDAASEDPTRVQAPAAPRNLVPVTLAAALVVAAGLGGFVYFLVRTDDRAVAASQLAEKLVVQEERRAAAQPAAAAAPAPARLDVESDPEAEVVATWENGGVERGRTPLSFQVPRGAHVRLELSRAGYVSWSTAVVAADDSQSLRAALKPEPAAAGLVPPARRAGQKMHRSPAEHSADGVVDVLGDLR